MKHSRFLLIFLAHASTCSLLGMKLWKADIVWGSGNGENPVPKHTDELIELESGGGFDYVQGFGSGLHGQHGQFNSDTSGCSAIETKSCHDPRDCAGCLGLYSCNIALGKCQLKGLSRKSSGFYQSLKDA